MKLLKITLTKNEDGKLIPPEGYANKMFSVFISTNMQKQYEYQIASVADDFEFTSDFPELSLEESDQIFAEIVNDTPFFTVEKLGEFDLNKEALLETYQSQRDHVLAK